MEGGGLGDVKEIKGNLQNATPRMQKGNDTEEICPFNPSFLCLYLCISEF